MHEWRARMGTLADLAAVAIAFAAMNAGVPITTIVPAWLTVSIVTAVFVWWWDTTGFGGRQLLQPWMVIVLALDWPSTWAIWLIARSGR